MNSVAPSIARLSPQTGAAPFRACAATAGEWPAFTLWRLWAGNSPILQEHPARAGAPAARGRADFGKGSTAWFFGFKLPARVHHSGLIVPSVLRPADFDEREAALVLSGDGGPPLGELGYRSRGD